MKIYTKTGDSGETSLVGSSRVAKNSPPIEAIGALDELNCHVGIIRSFPIDEDLETVLLQVQRELFQIGSIVATPADANLKISPLDETQVAPLEEAIDRLEQQLTPLKNFILPDGVPTAAATHLARSVCRRAERRMLNLLQKSGNARLPFVLIYLNRLGDLLFVLARTFNSRGGYSESIWSSDRMDKSLSETEI